MNVALGAATQWLFNFIIARSRLTRPIEHSFDGADSWILAVLTMQQTMGEAGYVSCPLVGR